MPKSLTVSQLLGRRQFTLRMRVLGHCCPPHWGAGTAEKGLQAQAAWGGARPQGRVRAGWGVLEGRPGENSLSGKTGIHFKISAQKGQRGCSQTRYEPCLREGPSSDPRRETPILRPWGRGKGVTGAHTAHRELLRGRENRPPPGGQMGTCVWVGRSKKGLL